MRYFLAVMLAAGLLFSNCFAQEKPAFKELKDKESYSMGYQFGQSLKGQGVDINVDVYLSGLRDSLGGARAVLSQEEMQATVSNLQKRVKSTQAERNLTAGKTFMEENRKKEGVITLPSGLQYKALKEGSGKTPKAADEVTVNYKGALINGTEFDSSYKRGKPATFRVDGVIPGWTQALQLMKGGSKFQLVIPPELGYGGRDMGLIPPNSTLVFEVELLSAK